MFIGGSDTFCGFAKYHNSIWPHQSSTHEVNVCHTKEQYEFYLVFFMKISFYSSKTFSHLRWQYFKFSYGMKHCNSRNMHYYYGVRNRCRRCNKCRIKMSKCSKKSILATGFWVLFHMYHILCSENKGETLYSLSTT